MTPVILQQFRMFYQNAAPAEGGQRPIGVLPEASGQVLPKASGQVLPKARNK